MYKYYKQTQGWSKAEVDSNIFRRYSKSETNASAYDRKSIMHYYIPTELTQGDFTVDSNKYLSATDKSFIGNVYPKP